MSFEAESKTPSTKSSIFWAVVGPAWLCGSISYHISATKFDYIVELTKWFIERPVFTIFYYLAFSASGLVFTTAGRRGSAISHYIEKYGVRFTGLYASTSGGVAGWIIGVCVTAALDNIVRYWLIAVQLALITASLVAMPLVAIYVTHGVISAFNNKMTRDLSIEKYMRWFGCFILVYCFSGFLTDVTPTLPAFWRVSP